MTMVIRLLGQLQPEACNPFLSGPAARLDHALTSFVLRRPVQFCDMVLAGEEIPDLIQKRASEHPKTDPFFAAVSRYRRAEEARHLAYARLLLPELWEDATGFERFVVRWVTPAALRAVFDSLVHPGVYETIGLPGWKTWRSVRRSAVRVQFRETALSSVLRTLNDAGIFGKTARIMRPWRRLVGSDPLASSVEARARQVLRKI